MKPLKINSKQRLKIFAKKLKRNLPKSEIWFNSLYKNHRYDKDNIPFMKRIPDIINKKHKYIIEIDGSFHDRSDQIKIDILKNNLFIQGGYIVLRIKAYDINDFNKKLVIIQRIRKSKIDRQVYYDWLKQYITKNPEKVALTYNT